MAHHVQDHHDLVYLRARWHDPSSGAFASGDLFEGFDSIPCRVVCTRTSSAILRHWWDDHCFSTRMVGDVVRLKKVR